MIMQEYVPKEIESKWQKYWEEHNLLDFDFDSGNQKFYMLTMLPYPSGDLHIGHWYAMAPSDCYARFMKMKGFEVFFPIGFDAFGLPAENAAIKNNIHPKTLSKKLEISDFLDCETGIASFFQPKRTRLFAVLSKLLLLK